MSGRIQHHIPQSFQRGFLISEQPEQTHVYCSDKNYVSNINRVAAQRDFYSKPSIDGRKTLDDKITDYEGRLDQLLRMLRAVDIGLEADAGIAAEIIAHLTPRGKSIRRMFCSSATKLIMGISEIFADKEAIVSLIGLGEPAPNRKWKELIASAFDEDEKLSQIIELVLERTQIPKVSLDRVLFMFAKENMLGEANSIPSQFQQAFSTLLTCIDEFVSDSHKKMLNNGLVAEPRKQLLEEFTWLIHPAPTEGAIMPDCIALGFDEDGAFLPYIMTSAVSAVVMPLTSKKLLVGIRAGSTVFDLSDFNHEASECSDELFIAGSSTHADLSKNIGKRWKGKVDAIIQDALTSLHAYKNSQSAASPVILSPFVGYQISFIGWRAEEDITPISGMVQSLVEKLRQWLDLSRLDGISFTSEFEKTLTETEHGFDDNATPEGIPDHIAHGAAALLVIREGKLKVHIVFNKAYALSLIGEDMQDAGVALHLLVAGMSFAHTVNQFENTLPGFLMEPVMSDDHGAVLHCAMRKALRAYRYAYDSAEFGAEALFEQEFSNYLTQAIDQAYVIITKAKVEHAIDSDHPKLFKTVHAAVTDILIASARLIGHLDGMGKAPLLTPETSVGAAIAERELTGWINAFAYDLQQFWDEELWTQGDIYALNIHVERLLWPSGIFLYPADSGQGTMILSLQAV